MKKRPVATTADPHPAAVGMIRDGEVYRLRELQRRMGWGEHATRRARAAGLVLVTFGREKYALGADVLIFFRQLGERQTGNGQQASEGVSHDA